VQMIAISKLMAYYAFLSLF